MIKYRHVVFEALIGLTLSSIEVEKDTEELVFTTTCGRTFRMYHAQDCCESVSLEDVVGDFGDLIGNPILTAVVCTQDDDSVECGMWTFYKLATIKGYVDLRWYGNSNGFYSVSVDFAEIITLP